MSAPKIFLITGANRGIGKGLATKLILRPGVTVIATARDTAKAAEALIDLPKGEGSMLIVVKLDSDVDSDPATAVDLLKNEHGIAKDGVTVASTTPQNLRDHFNTNSIGPAQNPIFVAVSTVIGSIASQGGFSAYSQTLSPYGASKAALNWLVAGIHFEEPWLTAFVAHPGLVLTDLAPAVVPQGRDPVSFGAIVVDTSVTGLLKLVDTANQSEFGGKFKKYEGSLLLW